MEGTTPFLADVYRRVATVGNHFGHALTGFQHQVRANGLFLGAETLDFLQ